VSTASLEVLLALMLLIDLNWVHVEQQLHRLLLYIIDLGDPNRFRQICLPFDGSMITFQLPQGLCCIAVPHSTPSSQE